MRHISTRKIDDEPWILCCYGVWSQRIIFEIWIVEIIESNYIFAIGGGGGAVTYLHISTSINSDVQYRHSIFVFTRQQTSQAQIRWTESQTIRLEHFCLLPFASIQIIRHNAKKHTFKKYRKLAPGCSRNKATHCSFVTKPSNCSPTTTKCCANQAKIRNENAIRLLFDCHKKKLTWPLTHIEPMCRLNRNVVNIYKSSVRSIFRFQ